tara:strand:+ start:6205 stop:6609 length:405 start_codon:yes stop_codon:yes gene_type:complete
MKRGFTIIELLVVIAIIAMLTSIVLVVLSGIQAKSRDTRRMEDVRQIQKALSLYYLNDNRFPQAPSPITITGSDSFSTVLINSGSIPAVPADPVSPDFDYTYQATTSASYTITFCLETDSIPNFAEGCANTISP